MFQPETEDMLPRAAPKPTLGQNDAALRPTVPEVSIVFGQGHAPQQQENVKFTGNQSQQQPKQTYAAWRKQVLPKVTFPPSAARDGDNNKQVTTTIPEYMAARSSIYPLRTATATISPLVTTNAAEIIHYQRRILENSTPVYSSGSSHDSVGYMATHATLQQLQQTQQQQQHQGRSLDTLSTLSQRCQTPPTSQPHHEVLTICAGTQTSETLTAANHNDLASKEDISQLLEMLNEMRAEQLRLTQYCETLLIQQQQQQRQQSNTFYRDVATQCELSNAQINNIQTNVRRSTPIIHDYIEEECVNEAVPAQNSYNQCKQASQQQQTPRARPNAQSTAYQANTPQRLQRPLLQKQQHNNNVATVLPKPSTEKSIVMNELALKYLPNDKLNELMHEMHISPSAPPTDSPATPLRNIANLDKGPNDISNASYKYLKKYRLLPEEQHVYQEQQAPEHVETTPIATRQQQQQKQPSPYQRFNNNSPLLGSNRPEHLLDLEHIRHQPKFL